MSFIFNANETPAEREARKSKAIMGALEQGAMQQPTDLGSGLSAVGNAIAYRAMKAKQGGAAPSAGAQAAMGAGWEGVGGMTPQQSAASQAGPYAGIGRVAQALFRFGG